MFFEDIFLKCFGIVIFINEVTYLISSIFGMIVLQWKNIMNREELIKLIKKLCKLSNTNNSLYKTLLIDFLLLISYQLATTFQYISYANTYDGLGISIAFSYMISLASQFHKFYTNFSMFFFSCSINIIKGNLQSLTKKIENHWNQVTKFGIKDTEEIKHIANKFSENVFLFRDLGSMYESFLFVYHGTFIVSLISFISYIFYCKFNTCSDIGAYSKVPFTMFIGISYNITMMYKLDMIYFEVRKIILYFSNNKTLEKFLILYIK